MRLLERGDGLIHFPYTERRLTEADVARATRAGDCLVSGRAAAIVDTSQRGRSPKRLAIYAIGGSPSGVRALLGELRAEARRRGLMRVTWAAPDRWWNAARDAGYRRRWHDAMHIFERTL